MEAGAAAAAPSDAAVAASADPCLGVEGPILLAEAVEAAARTDVRRKDPGGEEP